MISQQNSLIEDKRMLCCCKSYLKTLVVLGLISFFGNIAFSAFQLFQKDVLFLILGLFFAFNSGILIIGALVESNKAILVWMILAIIQNIVYIILLLINGMPHNATPVYKLTNNGTDAEGTETTEHDIAEERKRVILSICCVIPIVFTIWTLTVAQKARKEIQEDTRIEPYNNRWDPNTQTWTHEVYRINLPSSVSSSEDVFRQTMGTTSTTLVVPQINRNRLDRPDSNP